MTRVGFRIFLSLGVSLGVAGCGGTSIFQPIGTTSLANPLTVAVDSANARAYVVNSNNKVLFTGGSLHVVNIAAPGSPTRVDTLALASFSGEIALDAVNRIGYIPNRLSDNVDDTADQVLRVDLNEAGGSFLNARTFAADTDPFGAAIHAAGNRLLVPTRDGFLDFYDISGPAPALQQVSLKRPLSDNTTLTTVDAVGIAVLNAQAWITRASGGVLVVNLNELTNTKANPVDYFISDFSSPRGIATDGTRIYVVNVETDAAGGTTPSVIILDPGNALPVIPDNHETQVKDKDTEKLLTAIVSVGDDPQQIVVGTQFVAVSNLGADTVTIFDRPDLAAPGPQTVTVGDEPFGLAFYNSTGGAETHLLVCNTQSNSVSIIRLSDRTVVGTYN